MSDYLDAIPGQPEAVRQLRAAIDRPVHAYLFVGPAGSGKQAAAFAFAACLLDDERAVRGAHADLVYVEREGASINVAQAREISRVAARSPLEGSRKVLVLDEFHLVDEAAPALLKTIEEAPASTVFLILADSVPRELVTVASRCVRIDFSALTPAVISDVLCSEGIEPERSQEAAAAAFGNLERARLLAVDDAVVARRNLWSTSPSVLDGSGATIARLADEIVAAIDHASEPLIERQKIERTRLEAKTNEKGVSGQALKNLDTRHKRELRRLRTDELRAGLATLAQAHANRLAETSDPVAARRAEVGLEAVQWASEALTFNPSELLMLQGLFVRMGQAPAAASASAR